MRNINPFAEVIRCNHAEVDLKRLLNVGSFDLSRYYYITIHYIFDVNYVMLYERGCV